MDWSAIVAASLGLFTVGSAFFKWLSYRFTKVETTAREIQTTTRTELEINRELQNKRHEENMYRFEKISVALARLGSSNGQH